MPIEIQYNAPMTTQGWAAYAGGAGEYLKWWAQLQQQKQQFEAQMADQHRQRVAAQNQRVQGTLLNAGVQLAAAAPMAFLGGVGGVMGGAVGSAVANAIVPSFVTDEERMRAAQAEQAAGREHDVSMEGKRAAANIALQEMRGQQDVDADMRRAAEARAIREANLEMEQAQQQGYAQRVLVQEQGDRIAAMDKYLNSDAQAPFIADAAKAKIYQEGHDKFVKDSSAIDAEFSNRDRDPGEYNQWANAKLEHFARNRQYALPMQSMSNEQMVRGRVVDLPEYNALGVIGEDGKLDVQSKPIDLQTVEQAKAIAAKQKADAEQEKNYLDTFMKNLQPYKNADDVMVTPSIEEARRKTDSAMKAAREWVKQSESQQGDQVETIIQSMSPADQQNIRTLQEQAKSDDAAARGKAKMALANLYPSLFGYLVPKK